MPTDSAIQRHFVSKSCGGETCVMCWREGGITVPATHKVGEELMYDSPDEIALGHNLTAYVCCKHFGMIFGPLIVAHWRGCDL